MQPLQSMPWNLTMGVTPMSRDIYVLHMFVLKICFGIALVVFGLMFYQLIAFRRRKGIVPAQFHSNIWIELVWTAIPMLILVVIAVPATQVLTRFYDTSESSLTIKITGKQWRWHYQYLDDQIEFDSQLDTPSAAIQNQIPKEWGYLKTVDKPLVLPIHQKIRFLFTSADVQHSWWVPALGIKKDSIPGFINEAWAIIEKPGIYYGQCAELCGVLHAYMPIVVDARTEDDFQAWLKAQKSTESIGGENDAQRS